MGPVQQAFAILAQRSMSLANPGGGPWVGKMPHPHDVKWALRTIEAQGTDRQRKLADGLGLQELAV